CMREKPVMSDFHDAHKDKDAIVVGVAIDGMANVASVRDRIREHRTTYPTLVGELGTIAVNFEAFAQEAFRGTPTFWLFNPTGELLGVNPGPVRPEAIESFIARKSSL
ncbi:MAG: TlpA family protein disulfide reductase, partial [Thiotrichales bacterium]